MSNRRILLRTSAARAMAFVGPMNDHETIEIGYGAGMVHPADLAGWLLACITTDDHVALALDLDGGADLIERLFARSCMDRIDEVHIPLPERGDARPDATRARTLLDRWAGPALVDDGVRVYARAIIARAA